MVNSSDIKIAVVLNAYKRTEFLELQLDAIEMTFSTLAKIVNGTEKFKFEDKNLKGQHAFIVTFLKNEKLFTMGSHLNVKDFIQEWIPKKQFTDAEYYIGYIMDSNGKEVPHFIAENDIDLK